MSTRAPTPEEFERASIALEKRSRGLDQVRDEMLCEFGYKQKLHEFFIFDLSEVSFKVYMFFESEKDLNKAINSDSINTLKQATINLLESSGRGREADLLVDFEFDSHEVVLRDHKGDYYDRLR